MSRLSHDEFRRDVGDMNETLNKAATQWADNNVQEISAQLRAARLDAMALADFPGPMPETLSESYAIQDRAISGWPDIVQGWKVGRISGDLINLHGTDRLIGPIFRKTLHYAEGPNFVEFDAIEGGFCAVEGEYVFELARDAVPSRTDYDIPSALELVDDLWTGIEIAGSPMARINALGPTVVIADFGNNAGLILGQRLIDWRAKLADLACVVKIEGEIVGTGSVATIPSGIEQSLVFALNCAASRGLPLKAGMLISTGAVTGVHPIAAGAYAHADFGSGGAIFCRRRGLPLREAKPARPPA
jgi:2-keto-4-pentenoate hydratase